MFGSMKMGSYAVYGGTGAAGVYIKTTGGQTQPPVDSAVAEFASTEAAESFFGALLRQFELELVNVVDGRVYLGDISALELGSMMLISFSLIATGFKAFYDYTDWRDRKLARIKILGSKESTYEKTTTVEGTDSIPPPD